MNCLRKPAPSCQQKVAQLQSGRWRARPAVVQLAHLHRLFLDMHLEGLACSALLRAPHSRRRHRNPGACMQRNEQTTLSNRKYSAAQIKEEQGLLSASGSLTRMLSRA